MSRHLEPHQENPFIEIGRLLSDEAYKRDTKEIKFLDEKEGGMILDLIRSEGEEVVVAEIKKSSSFEKAATMQLAYYLYRLKKLGILAKGVLLFPKEKKKVEVTLTEELERELISAQKAIQEILLRDLPPEPKRIRYCSKCGYQELCWA